MNTCQTNVLLFVACLLTSACTTVTDLGDWVTTQDRDNAATSPAKPNASSIEPTNAIPTGRPAGQIQLPVDVDTAYLKIKREFNYLTEQEHMALGSSAATTSKRLYIQSPYFYHEASPGIRYSMRRHIKQPFQDEVHSHSVEMVLEKDGPNGTVLYYNYDYDFPEGVSRLDDYNQLLEERIRTTIGI